MGGLRPVEERQHPVRRRVRSPPQRKRDPRDRRPSGRHPDRAFPHIGEEGINQLVERINVATRAAGEPDFKFKTIPQGAATSVWAGAVAAADDVGGRYCEDCHVAAIEPDATKRAGVKPYALNPETAKALWAKSEEMVGERF